LALSRVTTGEAGIPVVIALDTFSKLLVLAIGVVTVAVWFMYAKFPDCKAALVEATLSPVPVVKELAPTLNAVPVDVLLVTATFMLVVSAFSRVMPAEFVTLRADVLL
jgi:hypothetical protein